MIWQSIYEYEETKIINIGMLEINQALKFKSKIIARTLIEYWRVPLPHLPSGFTVKSDLSVNNM